jgi:DMSO/TMAO reductase YedYZ molybdopterin-dependent catalytic subunit
MSCSSGSKKALTKVRSVVIALVAVVVAVAGVVCYLSLPAFSPNLPPGEGSGSDWMLLVDGHVLRPLNLSLDEIMAMPRSAVNAEIICLPSPGASPGIMVDSGNWVGVRLGFVLEETGLLSEAVKVAFYAEDGFTTDLTIEAASREDVLLVYEKDGEPLPETLRLAAPGMWGYKWIKWLIRIEVVDYDFKGTYESMGFPDDAQIPE